jgi:hypothetical protein
VGRKRCEKLFKLKFNIMPINQLVIFCNEHHNRLVRCVDCPNEVCHNNCIACLESIHQVGNRGRTYNCNNIIYCYTCKYIYRYSTEIEYLLNRYLNTFINATTVKIWSVGCGPCTELFGLHNFKISNNLNFAIQYKGFDLSTCWKPIHEQINQLQQFQTEFYYQNVFDYVNSTDECPNIIILNYLISDILRTNKDYIDGFINSLCEMLTQFDNCILIINDINLGRNDNQSRHYYDLIETRIQESNHIIHVGKYHYANSQRWFYPYGIRNANNRVQLDVDQGIQNRYSPWLECRSAQLVIFKQPIQ